MTMPMLALPDSVGGLLKPVSFRETQIHVANRGNWV